MKKDIKSKELLESFVKYCYCNKQERFWQALRNWSHIPFILASEYLPPDKRIKDTFYWNKKCDT